MKKALLIGSVLVIGASAAVLLLRTRNTPQIRQAKHVTADALPGDRYYASDRSLAKAKYSEFVKSNEKSPDAKIQDQVGQARMKIAYLASKENDFKGARSTFKEAETKYKGEGKMNADFGGIQDGAAYQAAVCLVAEGKKAEATDEFRKFLKNYPLSPLVHAVRQRLVRLNGAISREDDRLVQNAISAQEKRVLLETAMCGPKCAVKLLELLGKKAPGYKDLAKLCGTTENGTTMEGLRNGLAACGLRTYGFSLNRKDFAKMPLPAILFSNQHYVLVTALEDHVATVFDPALDKIDRVPLAPLDTPEFSATVLLTSIPEIQTS